MFSNSYFIKPSEPYRTEFAETNSCPIFYTEFEIEELPQKAVLNVCALGIGYAYVNGKKITDDLFAPPCADYEKTLWYMAYDVTRNLKNGKNTIAVICGNGFLSEDMNNAWKSHEAAWRDHPKLICELEADGKVILGTTNAWKCTMRSPYLMNRFRQGVTFDARIPMPDSKDFSACGFDQAIKDDRAPKGVFRLCECEPIRMIEDLKPIGVLKIDQTTDVYDFGYNSSGFVRIRAKGKAGQVITVKYAEEIYPDGSRKMNNMDHACFYKEGEFAVERFICSGNEDEWHTLMSYYGFRYVQIICEDKTAVLDVTGAFVYQQIEQRSSFECSDPFLNKIFECGIRASKSNFFYMPTDCPTREKYGWMNDAQSSAEQFLTNFHAEKMLIHWNRDIRDALDDEKGLPGIVPTHGWGYHWGNGPVSDGSMFEQAYRIYLHSGLTEPLIGNLPYFKRYFAYLDKRCGKGVYPDFGLYDWANPQGNVQKTPLLMINGIYMVKFNRIAALAARLAHESASEFEEAAEYWKRKVITDYVGENGECNQDYQTAVAMLLYHGIYDDIEPLKRQLARLVEQSNFLHDCGMVGLRHLYIALNICGLQEYAMKIVTADGYPCYRKWIDEGATTLWEKWDRDESKNHQMYSDVLSWMMKTVAGIAPDENKATFESIEISPYYFEGIDYSKAHYDSPKGRVCVDWKRENGIVTLNICAPCDGYVIYDGKPLGKGVHTFVCV